MNANKPMPDETVLDQATRALRNAPVPELPPALVEQLLILGADSNRPEREGFLARVRHMTASAKVAAIITILVITGTAGWLLPHHAGEAIAFADVLQKVRAAR